MFVFLRDPITQVVSQYSTGENREVAAFDWFIEKGANSISRMVGDLSQYFFVGLQERFEESIEMFEWYTGIEFKKPLEYRNVGNGGHYRRDKYEPTPEEYSLIEEHNQADIEIYNQACTLFYKQKQAFDERKQE